MRREIPQRVVVECGEPVGEQRGPPIREDFTKELRRGDGPAEDRVAPQPRRERHRNRFRCELDPHRLAAVQLGGNRRDIDAETRQQLHAIGRPLVGRLLHREHPVLVTKLQPDEIEKVPQPASFVFYGRHRERDDNRVRLERRQRRLKPLDHLAMSREPCELRVGVGVPALARVVDDPHELGQKPRPIGHDVDPQRLRRRRRPADDRDVFGELLRERFHRCEQR